LALKLPFAPMPSALMASFAPDSAKSRPEDVIRQVLDGIESGANEVLADEMTRHVRAELGKPIA